MNPPKLLVQLNDIRFHLEVVFMALKNAQTSLNRVRKIATDIEVREKPKLELVVNNVEAK